MPDTSQGLHIYIAGPWLHRNGARSLSILLEREGHTVTRRWWDCEGEYTDHDAMREHAQADLDSIMDADVFVLFACSPSEGKATELGWALYRNMPIIAIGTPYGDSKNIFYHLDEIHWCATVADAITCLNERDWH